MYYAAMLAEWLFVMGVVLAAAVVTPMTADHVALPRVLLFAVAAFGGCSALLRSDARCLAGAFRTAAGMAAAAFAAIIVASPLWSIAPLLSVAGVEPRFEGMLAYVVFFALAASAGAMAYVGHARVVLRAIAGSNVGVVAYGLLQVFHLDPFVAFWVEEAFLGRAFSSIGQPNALAQFLVLTAPFTVLAAWRWKGVSAAAGALAANLVVLLATGSRAGMIGAVVAGGFLMLQVLPAAIRVTLSVVEGRHDVACNSSTTLTTTHRHIFGALIFLLIAIFSLPLAFRRFSFHGEWSRSIDGRIAIWRDAASMIRARPMGWGLETTGLLFPRFQRTSLAAYEPLTVSIDRAHSKPLDLILTVGLPGLLLYYAFVIFLVARCLRVWRSHRDDPALAGAIALIGLSVSLLFGFEGIVVHAFFWLVCGMLVGLTLPAGDCRCDGLPIQSFRRTLFLFSIVLLAIIFFILLSLSARITAGRAEQAFQAGDLGAATRLYGSATSRAPWDRALLIIFIETALLARERAADAATQEAIDAVLVKRLRHLEWLTGGSDPLSPSLRAWHAALRGERKEALAFLDDARLSAHFSIPRLRIAGKCAELLGDTSMREAIRAELARMLPLWRDDIADTRRRILWKENPWLEEFMPSPFQGRGDGDGY